MIKNKTKIILLLSFVFLLSACKPAWEIEVFEDGRNNAGVINQESVEFYITNYQEETNEIPLGQMLYDVGYTLVDEITFKSDSDSSITYIWDEIGETAVIQGSGEITLKDGTKILPDQIEIEAPSISNYYSIMDIAPTIAYAMEWPPLPDAMGEVRVTHSGNWEYAVVILLDGLQYGKLEDLINSGALPFLEQLEMLRKGITVYPPITTSSTAAFLTSTTPQKNGVYGYSNRSTEKLTLFDVAAQENLEVIAVEGHSLAFNLRNAETILSGDRDENGFTNDNVFENSLEVIRSDMPDLLYIHFHDIDDIGHQYGPFSPEYETAIIQVDSYLEEIFTRLPEVTLITIFADHGMHKTEDGGNHGTLTAADLIIPIIFIEK